MLAEEKLKAYVVRLCFMENRFDKSQFPITIFITDKLGNLQLKINPNGPNELLLPFLLEEFVNEEDLGEELAGCIITIDPPTAFEVMALRREELRSLK